MNGTHEIATGSSSAGCGFAGRFPESLVAPYWARGGHRQTILGHLLPSAGSKIAHGHEGWREVAIPTQDGEVLSAFLHEGDSGTRVHLLHGLSGDVNSDYMRRTAACLVKEGHEVLAVNHRGAGEGKGRALVPYHSGKVEDLDDVLAFSRASRSFLRNVVVGFSLSGNLALLHAAKLAERAADGILAINPPADLTQASVAIGRGLCRIYELRFLHRLAREVAERRAAGGLAEARPFSRFSSLLEFDDRVTAPTCGFANGRDYYARCSSGPRWGEIRTPTVVLTSADDPFVCSERIREFQEGTSVRLHLETHGGHVGYLDQSWTRGGRWLDRAVRHYVSLLSRLD